MDRSERFIKIEQMLASRTVVPRSVFLEELGISIATFKRDLEYLRDRLNSPIEWDRDAEGYRLSASKQDGPVFSLPGLWFNESEIHALLLMQKLLADIQPGLLGKPILHWEYVVSCNTSVSRLSKQSFPFFQLTSLSLVGKI